MPIPSALVQYKNGDYKSINQFLRGNAFSMPSAKRVEMEEKVQNISDAMTVGFPSGLTNGVLYRGASFLDFSVHSENLLRKKIGKTGTWKFFVSTSISDVVASRFAKDVLMQITPSQRTRYYDFGEVPAGGTMFKNLRNEKEILLDHGTRYKITDIQSSSSKPIVVSVKLI